MRIEFDWPSKTTDFLSWIYFEWNYICGKTGKREKGFRLFGFTIRNGACICGDEPQVADQSPLQDDPAHEWSGADWEAYNFHSDCGDR